MITYTFKIDTHDGLGLRTLPIKTFQGNSDIRVLGEELDSGFMVLWLKNKENLPIMSYVEYTISDDSGSITRKFYIGRDDTNRLSKNKNYYEHNIELIELTKKLEKFLSGTICFTQPTEIGKVNYTLKTCIERIIRIFPLGIDSLTNDYRDTSENLEVYPLPNNRIIQDVDADLESFLSNIEAPQFVFHNPTLREAIDGVLKYVNAVARLDTYYNIPNVLTVYNKLGAEFYGYLKNLVANDRVYSYNISQNIEDYASQTKSFAKNVNLENFKENQQYIQYPHLYKLDSLEYNGYEGERIKSSDNEYQINDSNCGILTQHPIKSVLSLQIPIRISAVYTTDLSSETEISASDLNLTHLDYYVELSDYILEDEAFLNLTDKEKGQYFHYRLNDNFIDCSSSFKAILFTKSSVLHVIQKGFVDLLREKATPIESAFGYRFVLKFIGESYNIGEKEIDFYVFNDDTLGFIVGGVVSNGNANFHKDARYRITYISQTNSLVSSENENLYDVNVNTQNNINQEDRVISFSNFTNTLYSLSQRTGTKDLELTCKHFNISDIIDIGDYTNENYVVTKAEYVYYNNYVLGKYILDRNYNRISSYIGINADIRQYDIPSGSDTYQRQCEIDSYVEISRENNIQEDVEHIFDPSINKSLTSSLGAYDNKTNVINHIGLKLAIITYDNNYTYNQEINDYFTELSNISSPALKLECFGKGEKNVLSFDFGFKDNINAGEFVTSSTEGIFEDIKLIKQKIPYCMYYGDKIGFLRNLNVKLVTQRSSGSTTNYLPLISTDGLDSAIEVNNLMVLKDPMEILRFTYKMNFISLDEKITLGRWFFNNNYIFKTITESKDDTSNETFTLYYSNKKYSKWDINKLSDTTNVQLEWDNFSDISPLTHNVIDESKADFYIQFNKDVMPEIPSNTKTIIIANGNDIVMTVAYDALDLNENGENVFFEPIYFNFRTKRSKIVYEY